MWTRKVTEILLLTGLVIIMARAKNKTVWLNDQAAAAAKSLQSCPTLRPHRRQPTRLLCPWDSPGKNTGVGCHFLLQWSGMLCPFKAWQLSVISMLASLVFDTPWFWSLIVIVMHYLNENFDIIYCSSSLVNTIFLSLSRYQGKLSRNNF